MRKIQIGCLFALLSTNTLANSNNTEAELSVWVNEAIVSTYHYSYKNFLERQKEIAKYFTANGWTAYSTALLASNLPDSIKTNAYFVNSVATNPPALKSTGADKWQAVMPLLVVYKNPQYQQRQNLEVTINFGKAPSGQGVRGYAITSLQSRITKPACKCPVEEPSNAISESPSPASVESVNPAAKPQ